MVAGLFSSSLLYQMTGCVTTEESCVLKLPWRFYGVWDPSWRQTRFPIYPPPPQGGTIVFKHLRRAFGRQTERMLAGNEPRIHFSYFYDRPHDAGGRIEGAAALKVLERLWREDHKSRYGAIHQE